MSATSAIGSPSVQKIILEKNVAVQLHSSAFRLSIGYSRGFYVANDGSIVLHLRCNTLTAFGWDEVQPLADIQSLLEINLSGCSKLESIPRLAFADCRHLVNVVFGELSNITN